jgi:cytochrome c oxidase subunit II
VNETLVPHLVDSINLNNPAVSSYAGDIDNLILIIGIIVMAWFFAALGLFLYFIVKFREKPGQQSMHIDGYNPMHKRWITYPHNAVLVFDVVVLVLAVSVWNRVKIDQPEPQDHIKVIGQRWAWTFVHAGKDGKLDTTDDIKTADELHVKLGDVVRFEGTSKDVLHSFSVPAFRLKQDVIPGRWNNGWFKAQQAGTYDIQCTEICGIGHGVMRARVVVDAPDDHAKWVAANSPR